MLAGLWSLWSTLSARRTGPYPFTSLLGFLLTGMAALGLGSFILAWGLGPF